MSLIRDACHLAQIEERLLNGGYGVHGGFPLEQDLRFHVKTTDIISSCDVETTDIISSCDEPLEPSLEQQSESLADKQ